MIIDLSPQIWNTIDKVSIQPHLITNISKQLNPVKMSKVKTCFRYGPGGGQETKNALCVLGLNMINDKIFMVFEISVF